VSRKFVCAVDFSLSPEALSGSFYGEQNPLRLELETFLAAAVVAQQSCKKLCR
jgi:hypothetical protein